MIRQEKFEIPYFVYSIPNHRDLKPVLLTYIEKSSGQSSKTDYEVVYKTDWYINKNPNSFYQHFIASENNYYALLKPHIYYIINQIIPDKNKKDLTVIQGWYVQYNKLNYYTWHDHLGSKWSMIYYLELSSDNPITEFENFYGETITPDVSEGDFIIFPSWIKHRAPPNKSTNRKTIFSFNIAKSPGQYSIS